jgi:hypothetical protein
MTPEGWDEIDPELLSAVKQMRKLFVALEMTGFTSFEAAQVIGTMFAAQIAINPPPPEGS